MQPREASVNQSTDASPVPRADWLTLLLLLAAGLAVRFLHLVSKPFWFDECFSVEVARISWGNLLRLLWWREANMSLYYALLRIWLHFGQTEFFIRSLSVLICAATLPPEGIRSGLGDGGERVQHPNQRAARADRDPEGTARIRDSDHEGRGQDVGSPGTELEFAL